MKIRTAEQAVEALDADLSWRKKELTAIHFGVMRTNRVDLPVSTAIRAGITLLYAHWEGFLKKSSEVYVEYVGRQGLNNNQLSDCFLIMSARSVLSGMGDGESIDKMFEVNSFYQTKLGQQATISWKGAVKTDSNLSSEVLARMSKSLGIDYSVFEPKRNLIDEKLLKRRNGIAHGEFLETSQTDFSNLYTEISILMDFWKTALSNAIASRSFIRV